MKREIITMALNYNICSSDYLDLTYDTNVYLHFGHGTCSCEKVEDQCRPSPSVAGACVNDVIQEEPWVRVLNNSYTCQPECSKNPLTGDCNCGCVTIPHCREFDCCLCKYKYNALAEYME